MFPRWYWTRSPWSSGSAAWFAPALRVLRRQGASPVGRGHGAVGRELSRRDGVHPQQLGPRPGWLGRPKRGRRLDHARFQLVTPPLGVDAEGVDLGDPLASRSGHHRQQESDLLLWARRGHRVIGSRVEAQSSLGAAPRSSRRGRSSCSRWRDSPASGRPPGRRTRDEEPWPPSRGCDPPSGPATVDRSARRDVDQ